LKRLEKESDTLVKQFNYVKLLSAAQIHEWDAYTIRHEPITSIDLMERAAQACTDWIMSNGFAEKLCMIFCGKGNNGGDGLAIARQLIQQGVEVEVYILEFGAIGTEDFQTNLQQLHSVTTRIHFIQSADFFPTINKDAIVIDALFGSGLNRPLKDLTASLVQHINNAAATVIAIDVPSGMPIESSCKNEVVIKATHTLTFQITKLCLLVAENAPFFGQVYVLGIGLHQAFAESAATTFETITPDWIAANIKHRSAFSHKGTYGHALLIAGNTGKMGACILATKACLRSGVGLLTVQVPAETFSILQTAMPEAMLMNREDDLQEPERFAAIGIGPAIGTDTTAGDLLQDIVRVYRKPIVIDADAITALSKNKELLNEIPGGSIFSPHPKEFDRLFGDHSNDFERMYKAINLSEQYGFVLVLKGHHTLIAYKGKGYFNLTGNAGMATGGTGDVLTGILTSLLAQQYEPLHAAMIGVYLHGLSADIALQYQSEESLLPSDIIEHLGDAFNEAKTTLL